MKMTEKEMFIKMLVKTNEPYNEYKGYDDDFHQEAIFIELNDGVTFEFDLKENILGIC